MKKRTKPFLLFPILFLIAGLAIGWFFGDRAYLKKASDGIGSYMRLTGYKYISPLLLCDDNSRKDSKPLAGLETKIQNFIDQNKQDKKLDDASVFIREINSGDQISVNPDIKYFPASLTKVPFLIAFLKSVESNPGLLNQEAKVTLSSDFNAGQEVVPQKAAELGKTYKVEDMLTMLIKNSDNNSLYTLVKLLDQKTFNTVYEDLGLKFPENVNVQEDYMTTYDFAYFLRILYNSTYLKRDLSEKALGLMSEVDYAGGLRAGLPNDITLANKFGLQTINDSSTGVGAREMHDCGIVYAKDNPYVICTMTKSTASVEEIGKIIQNISLMTFEEIGK